MHVRTYESRAEDVGHADPQTVDDRNNDERNELARQNTCDHKPGDHAPCASADTKATEGYTDELVIQLHAAVAEWCRAKGAR